LVGLHCLGSEQDRSKYLTRASARYVVVSPVDTSERTILEGSINIVHGVVGELSALCSGISCAVIRFRRNGERHRVSKSSAAHFVGFSAIREPVNREGPSDIFRGWCGYQWTKPETWTNWESRKKNVVGDGSARKRPGHVVCDAVFCRCGITPD
jgi:hypothetical protein